MFKKTRAQRASEKLYKEGLDSVTLKFVIRDERKEEHKFYLTVAVFEDQVDLIDLTVSGSQEHNIRALMESNFKLATRLLRDENSLLKLVEHWKGYRFEPHGVCKQLTEHYGYDRPSVASPLDCAAKILRARFLGGAE